MTLKDAFNIFYNIKGSGKWLTTYFGAGKDTILY